MIEQKPAKNLLDSDIWASASGHACECSRTFYRCGFKFESSLAHQKTPWTISLWKIETSYVKFQTLVLGPPGETLLPWCWTKGGVKVLLSSSAVSGNSSLLVACLRAGVWSSSPLQSTVASPDHWLEQCAVFSNHSHYAFRYTNSLQAKFNTLTYSTRILVWAAWGSDIMQSHLLQQMSREIKPSVGCDQSRRS